MNKNKFTKGEWAFDEQETYAIYADETKIICSMEYGCDEIDIPEVEANAYLIAAAPDLLAACESAINLYAHGIGAMADIGDSENQKRNEREAKKLMVQINKALAKAKSE